MEKMFRRLLSFAVALVMVLGMVPAGNLNVLAAEENAVTGLSGAGTEADPYLINNLEELIWFRDSVDNVQTDSSNEYLGQYFKLTADIDLTGINWNPIGETADHGAFKGNFDGGDHTISNLYIEQAGSNLGFFARTSHYDESLAPTTIKNLTFRNVTVKSTNSGTHVGGVIGNAGAWTYLDNVKVTGTVDISGRAYVGGIVGHGYPKINNCHVEATGSVACTYWCSGGIVGYGGEGGTRITNSSVTGTGDGLKITTVAGGAAAACGLSVSDNYFENISATNVDIVSLGNGYNPDYCLGYLVGNGEENCVLKNLTYTDVTLTAGDGEGTPTDIVVPELPTATVSVIKNEDLTFAMNFKADTATQAQLDYYGDWYADYVLTVNKDVTFNANGGADGYLSGQYDAWSANWVNVPFENVTLNANEPLKIMEYAAELMNKQGLKYTYAEVYESVKDFDCGIYFTPEFLAANPDLQVTLELRMYNNEDETESYAIGTTQVVTIPELPTATVTKIENDDLTFALNFKVDEANDAQLYYYGDWYADYVLTVNKDVTFNSNGTADGWLSGQYDAWNANWINVPPEDVTLKAGESLKIMEYAAKLLNQGGLKLTYADVYNAVKDFDCGIYFDPEFLAANPGLEVTLELRMFNPENEDINYVIGEKYEFEIPPLPTATVTEIENEDLTFAMNFKADTVTQEQLDYYGKWYADYVLTINKDVTFNANGGADGYLSGQYDAWSANWVNVPFENVTLNANEPLKIMEYAAELMNKQGLKYTYAEVYQVVKDFDCGVFFTPEFLAANPDLEVTLELRMFNYKNEEESYVIGDTYVFRATKIVAKNEQTEKTYATVAMALSEAKSGETVHLMCDAPGEKVVVILNNRTLDLNGFTLEAEAVVTTSNGAHIEDSSDCQGLLKIAKEELSLITNEQVPVWMEELGGYRFAKASFGQWTDVTAKGETMFAFHLKGAESAALIGEELADGAEDGDGLQVQAIMSFTNNQGSTSSLTFNVPAKVMKQYGAVWNTNAMAMYITGLETISDISFQAVLVSGDVVIAGEAIDYVLA